MDLRDFKGSNSRYDIYACNRNTGEVYRTIPESAIADIASEFRITNKEALKMLDEQFNLELPEIVCPSKECSFWIEKS
jgi:hypothetical protein